jgi:magnesium-transporting ATPase (P-type)
MAQVRSQINILKRDYEGDPEDRREKINRLQKIYDQVARQGYRVMEAAGVSR